jgi:hypothetical protein
MVDPFSYPTMASNEVRVSVDPEMSGWLNESKKETRVDFTQVDATCRDRSATESSLCGQIKSAIS